MPDPFPIDRLAVNVFERYCLSNKWRFQETERFDTLGIDGEVEITGSEYNDIDMMFRVQIKGSMNSAKFYSKFARKERISHQFDRKRLEEWSQSKTIPIMICIIDINKDLIYWEFIHSMKEDIRSILATSNAKSPVIYIPSSNIFFRDKYKIIWTLQRFYCLSDTITPFLFKLINKSKTLENRETQTALISLIRIGAEDYVKKAIEIYEFSSTRWRLFILECLRLGEPNLMTLDYLAEILPNEPYYVRQSITDYLIDFGNGNHLEKCLKEISRFRDYRFDGKKDILLEKLGIVNNDTI